MSSSSTSSLNNCSASTDIDQPVSPGHDTKETDDNDDGDILDPEYKRKRRGSKWTHLDFSVFQEIFHDPADNRNNGTVVVKRTIEELRQMMERARFTSTSFQDDVIELACKDKGCTMLVRASTISADTHGNVEWKLEMCCESIQQHKELAAYVSTEKKDLSTAAEPVTSFSKILFPPLFELIASFGSVVEVSKLRTTCMTIHEAFLNYPIDVTMAYHPMPIEENYILKYLIPLRLHKSEDLSNLSSDCSAYQLLQILGIGTTLKPFPKLSTSHPLSLELMRNCFGYNRAWKVVSLNLGGMNGYRNKENMQKMMNCLIYFDAFRHIKQIVLSVNCESLFSIIADAYNDHLQRHQDGAHPPHLPQFSQLEEIKGKALIPVGKFSDLVFASLSLKVLDLSQTPICSDIEGLSSLVNLEVLKLADRNGPTTNRETYAYGDCVHLKQLVKLKVLHLNNSMIQGNLKSLEYLTLLRELDIGRTSIKGQLSDLTGMHMLQSLNLHRSMVAGDVSTLKFAPHLKELYIVAQKTKIVGDIYDLASAHPELTVLTLTQTGVSGKLSSLIGLKHLERVSTHDTKVEQDIDEKQFKLRFEELHSFICPLKYMNS